MNLTVKCPDCKSQNDLGTELAEAYKSSGAVNFCIKCSHCGCVFSESDTGEDDFLLKTDESDRFKEMASACKGAIEDFNDFADDRAIAWASDELSRLRAEVKRLTAKLAVCAQVLDEYIAVLDGGEIPVVGHVHGDVCDGDPYRSYVVAIKDKAAEAVRG